MSSVVDKRFRVTIDKRAREALEIKPRAHATSPLVPVMNMGVAWEDAWTGGAAEASLGT